MWRRKDSASSRLPGQKTATHQLDDRMAVEWLLTQHDRGDVVLTTRLALPAVWWYADAQVSPPTLGGFLRDRNPILEIDHVEQDAAVTKTSSAALLTYRRALVYLGFRFDDVPPGFDDFLLQELRRIGRVTESQRFPGVTRALVVDIVPSRQQSARATTLLDSRTPTTGCISVRPARRW